MGSSTPETHGKPAVTSVRIERDRLEELKRIAAAERRSVSQQLRWLIDKCIEEEQAA